MPRLPRFHPDTSPAWFTQRNPQFDLASVLRRSCFYPACGTDGSVVRLYSRFFHSFIYVDWYYSEEQVRTLLEGKRTGFLGYDPVKREDVTDQMPWLHDDPRMYWMLREQICEPRDRCEPYALWCVFERNRDVSPSFGPKRFSILFVGYEAVAAYRELYVANNLAPDGIAVICPGTGYGLNWTDFRQADSVFHRAVIDSLIRSGRQTLWLATDQFSIEDGSHLFRWPHLITLPMAGEHLQLVLHLPA